MAYLEQSQIKNFTSLLKTSDLSKRIHNISHDCNINFSYITKEATQNSTNYPKIQGKELSAIFSIQNEKCFKNHRRVPTT